MLAVPVDRPVTAPEVSPTETLPLALCQVPPSTELVSVTVLPIQTPVGPLIVPDTAELVTVTVCVAVTVPHSPETA